MPTFSKQDYSLLEKGLDLLEITLNAEQTAQFSAYMAEIALFNRKYRLVGAEGADFVVKHLLDSLAPVSYFNTLLTARPEPLRICDVGSGAGLPGIPLAIVLNKNPFTLIERSGRRAGFLRNAVAMCNLSERVEIIEKDLSDVQDQFDIITFRAFHPLYDVINSIGNILAEGGYVCAYKGRLEAIEEELRLLGPNWNSAIVPLSVPFLKASRNLCVLRKR